MRTRPFFFWSVASGLALLPSMYAGCSGDGTSGSTQVQPSGASSSGAGGSASSGGGGAGGAGGDGVLFDGGGSCTNGDLCDGGVCVSGLCCDVALACGDVCCASGQVCSFQKCEAPGADCADSTDCPEGQYCEQSLGDVQAPDGGAGGAGSCVGGAAVPNGKCLPKPPLCPPGTPDPKPGDPLVCLNSCEYKPPASLFAPELKYAWGGQLTPPYSTDIMMTPIVIELDDDDCDGKVTAKDIPEIVFSTFSGGNYKAAGVLHAISVVGGQVVEKWSAPGVHPTMQLAAGNIDGIAGNEIVGCGLDGAVHAWGADGTSLWVSAPTGCFMPSIADLDGDGAPEVVVEGGILTGAKGELKAAFSAPLASSFVVSDIDGDGLPDVVTSSQGFHADGSLFVDTALANTSMFGGTSDWKSPWPAVADFNKDGAPEVAVVDNLNHALSVWRYDAAQASKFTVVRAPVDINGALSPSLCPVGSWGNTHGGGPPTIADFNGDGTPDVAMAGGVGYAVLDGKKLLDPAVLGPDTFLWIKQTSDCSSASTGSTVFDFDGDGKAEVVYSDQQHLRIYEGPTGNVLWDTCNTTATLIENPVIADVDNDGHADVVAVSNAYGQGNPSLQCNDGVNIAQAGLRIFGDTAGDWVRTRRVWNEHAYHITNVEEDGTIPVKEEVNYTKVGLNNFRQNKQPGSEFAAPDAIVSIAPICSGDYGLAATVRNIGEAALPAGVAVGFYYGAAPGGALLGSGQTTKTLYPAESEVVVLLLPNPPPEVKSGASPIYAVVDDGNMVHPSWTECRVDNNTSASAKGLCDAPN